MNFTGFFVSISLDNDFDVLLYTKRFPATQPRESETPLGIRSPETDSVASKLGIRMLGRGFRVVG